MALFRNRLTENFYNGTGGGGLPQQLQRTGHQRLDAVVHADQLRDLRYPPGNRLEKLKSDRDDQWSIRINVQYRICFRWTDDQGAMEIEITDYH